MPIKKTTARKKAEGNRSKDSDLENKVEPNVKIELPEAPSFLCAVAKKEWATRGEELLAAGLMSKIDFAAFAFYCDSFAKWQQLNKKLKKKTENIVQERKETQVQRVNLLSTAAEKYKDSCLKFLKEFGMTPRSRVGMEADLGAVNALDPYKAHQERMKKLKKIK